MSSQSCGSLDHIRDVLEMPLPSGTTTIGAALSWVNAKTSRIAKNKGRAWNLTPPWFSRP